MSDTDRNNTETFSPGEIIVKKGDKARATYMVLSGKVRVYLENDGKVVDLAMLSEDEIFGETAIFHGSEYGANVMAIEETELYVITPEFMDEIMKKSDPIVRALIRMLISRLSDTNQKFVESETRGFIDVGFI